MTVGPQSPCKSPRTLKEFSKPPRFRLVPLETSETSTNESVVRAELLLAWDKSAVPAVVRVRSFDPSSQVIELALWTSVFFPVESDTSVVELFEELPFCDWSVCVVVPRKPPVALFGVFAEPVTFSMPALETWVMVVEPVGPAAYVINVPEDDCFAVTLPPLPSAAAEVSVELEECCSPLERLVARPEASNVTS